MDLNVKYDIDTSYLTNTESMILQYKFKPSSVDTTLPGTIEIKNKEAKIQLHNKIDSSSQTSELFQGVVSDTTANEYLLIFENGSVRLLKVTTVISSIRHVRNEEVFSEKNTFDLRKRSQRIVKPTVKKFKRSKVDGRHIGVPYKARKKNAIEAVCKLLLQTKSISEKKN
jgi:hypothetical protein